MTLVRRPKREFSLEFKQTLMDRIKSGETTYRRASRDYDLSYSVLHRWMTQSKNGALRGTVSPSYRERDLENEIRHLKELVAELYIQVDLLKKADIWKRHRQSVSSSIVTSGNLPEVQSELKRRAKS